MHKKLLNASKEEIGNINKIKHYYPFVNNDYKSTRQFSFNEVIGSFLSHISNTEIESFSSNKFKDDCLSKFEDLLDDPDYLDIVEEMYFKNEQLSLDSLIIFQTFKSEKKSKKVFEIFKDLLNNQSLNINFDSNINFMERVIVDELKGHFKNKKNVKCKKTYLPFLEESFLNDIKFMSKNKHYFLKNVERFFELYLFIYCSQLALNLQPYLLEKPKSRELYFILNHEKVSNERRKIIDKGYSNLYERAKYIFPYLSLLTALSKVINDDDLKFHEMLEKFEDNELFVESLDSFHKTFRDTRNLDNTFLNQHKSTNLKESLERIFKTSYEQFNKEYKGDRFAVFSKYIKAFENQAAKPFIQSRGRAGKILVLDQDTIILLTNISIGLKSKLRFQDLLSEFEKRGVYFDSKSRTELISLFERIGNIERKSDSGDAVYVKTTI